MLQPPVATPHRLPRAAEPSSRRHLWPSCCWLSTRLTTSSAIQGARHSPCIRSAKRLRLALLAADRGRVVKSSGEKFRMPAAHTRTTPPPVCSRPARMRSTRLARYVLPSLRKRIAAERRRPLNPLDETGATTRKSLHHATGLPPDLLSLAMLRRVYTLRYRPIRLAHRVAACSWGADRSSRTRVRALVRFSRRGSPGDARQRLGGLC